MLGFTAAYWIQAYGLSFEAKLFPGMLTAALLGLLAIILVQALRTTRNDGADTATQARVSWVALLRRILVVAVPSLLLLAWSTLGGAIFVWLAMLVLQLALGERRPAMLILLPTALAIVLSLLFSTLLHARIPAGIVGHLF